MKKKTRKKKCAKKFSVTKKPEINSIFISKNFERKKKTCHFPKLPLKFHFLLIFWWNSYHTGCVKIKLLFSTFPAYYFSDFFFLFLIVLLLTFYCLLHSAFPLHIQIFYMILQIIIALSLIHYSSFLYDFTNYYWIVINPLFKFFTRFYKLLLHYR